jgi:hypothetical protein
VRHRCHMYRADELRCAARLVLTSRCSDRGPVCVRVRVRVRAEHCWLDTTLT